MATYDKKGGFTTARKPVVNFYETQFVEERDKGSAQAGDIWEILNVCPGDEIKVVTTVMTANTNAATMDIGDTTNATRYATGVDLAVVAAPAVAGAVYFQPIDDKIILTFNNDVEDARFAVQILVNGFVAENIFKAGGEAR